MATIYFTRGYTDATDMDDARQTVGVDSETFEIVDKEDLIYSDDLPKLSNAETFEDVADAFESKGWEKAEV